MIIMSTHLLHLKSGLTESYIKRDMGDDKEEDDDEHRDDADDDDHEHQLT